MSYIEKKNEALMKNGFIIETFITDRNLEIKLMEKTQFNMPVEYETDTVLVRYNDSASCVEIPNGVTIIGSFAFCNNVDIKTVVIPDSVTQILPHAFDNCFSLQEVIINGNNLLSIEACAFAGCFNLIKINIPDSVTAIGDCAFTGCSSLQSVALPNSLLVLGEAAFAGCSQLSVKNYPKSIKTISKFAFSQTADILDIPEHVTAIEEGAFFCNFDADVFIPISVTKIGEDAFDKNYLETINYEGAEEQWKKIDNACDWTKDITINFNCKRQ